MRLPQTQAFHDSKIKNYVSLGLLLPLSLNLSFLGWPSAAWAGPCAALTSEQTYTSCPLPDSHFISVKDSPFCATGAGAAQASPKKNDDTFAIQSALNAALACRVPLYFPPGYYYVTKSLYLAGHSTNGAWRSGAEIYGTSMSFIEGLLSEPYPVFDATGLDWGKIHDLSISVNSTPWWNVGKATTGILLGVPQKALSTANESAMTGCNVTLEKVSVSASYPAVAAVINAGSDAMRVIKSQFTGPTSMVLSATNVTGVLSKFSSPLLADGVSAYQNGTMSQIYDSNFISTTGTGLWIDGFDAVSLQTSYFNTGGTSTSAIRVTAQAEHSGYIEARTNSLYINNVRQEPNGNTAPLMYFLDLQPGVHTEHGAISGVSHVTKGAYVHLSAGSSMNSYDLNFLGDNNAPIFDGDLDSSRNHQVGTLLNSTIRTFGGLPSFLGAGSVANSLTAYYGPPWNAPDGAFSSIVQQNQTILGTVALTSIEPNPPGGRGLQYLVLDLHNGPGQTRTYNVNWPSPLADPQHTAINCEVVDNVAGTNATAYNAPSPPPGSGSFLAKQGSIFGKTSTGFTINVSNSDPALDHWGELDCMAISK